MVVCASLVLTVVLTYPIAFNLGSLGRVNTNDGRWSLWVVAWVSHALTTDPANLFHANIFHPHRRALAFSEANLGAGLMGVPVWALTKNPYTTYNVVMIMGFVLSAAGMYYLARRLTGSRGAAAVAGVMYAFCPFVFARTAHIQLLLIWGLPWTMLAFHRWADAPSAGRAVTLALMMWLTVITCAYYGIFAVLMVGTGVLLFAATRGEWRNPRYWTTVSLAALVAIALTLPLFLPYAELQRETGFARTLDESRIYSADWGAWLASAAWAHRWWLDALGRFNEVLFPGILATTLGLAGAWIGLRRGRSGARGTVPVSSVTDPGNTAVPVSAIPVRRDVIALYLLIAAIAFWASFGPDAGLYTLVFHTFPVFSFLRAPGRMGIMVTLGLSVLAAVAIAAWIEGRRHRTPLAALLVLLAAAELVSAPLTQFREADPVTPAHQMLARLPRGPVIELPFFWERHDHPRHAYYMLQSTVHWYPLVNGYSDYIPQDFYENVVPLSSFPTRESFALLEPLDVRYAVFHLNMKNQRTRERLMERLELYQEYLRPLVTRGDVRLYEIVAYP